MYKICFITTVSMTLKAFIVDLAKYLYESGEFDITFICNGDESFETELPDYIHYIPVSMERGVSFTGFKATKELLNIFHENKFDIIQYSTPNAACYSSIAGFLARVPVRLYCQWGIAYVGFRGIKRYIFKVVEKMVCKLSTWVEPDSFSNLEFADKEHLYSKNKASVIWNGSASGVDLKKFDITKKELWCSEIRKEYQIPLNAFVYIFIGRITRDKGLNELLEAFRVLLQTKKNVYLLMVGNNEVTDDVNKELYKWSLVESHIIYSGFTTEVEKYISSSDVYVLPSYREGFGSSVIEAEAMGIPVIVTNIPGPINAMKKDSTGLVVSKANSQELFEAMKYLYENTNKREEMGKAAYLYAKNSFEQKRLFKMILEDRKKLIELGECELKNE